MRYLDNNPAIMHWSSEETIIPYISPKDNKYHRYFMDFKVWLKQKDNSIQVFLIEIKPQVQIVPPKTPKRPLNEMTTKQRRRFMGEAITWKVNQAKWKAAYEYCRKEGFIFKIINEDFQSYDYDPKHWEGL